MKAGFLLAAIALAAAVFWALMPRNEAANLLVTGAVVAPLDGGGAGVFATLENSGPPDTLVSAASDAAPATLYSPVTGHGVPVPTGTGALALDAAHVRLDGRFEDGTLIPLTLRFARAGEVRIKARLSDPEATGAAAEVGLFGLGDICIVGEGEPAPRISLSVEPDGAGWQVSVEAEEFTFSEELAGLYHVPGTGHGHLYVGGLKLGRLYAPTARIGALPSGSHEVRVTLNTNDHRAYVVDDVPVTASATIVVE